MKKHLALLLGLAITLPALTASATIVGSSHDFSLSSWNTRNGVCSPCHTAHNTDPSQIVPLWAHATTTQTFIPYDSPKMQAIDKKQQPSASSKACLSCHDGTVAVNQTFTTGATPVYTGGAAAAWPGSTTSAILGTNLSTTHPISITYDDTLATADGTLYSPSTLLQWTAGNGLAGKTIAQTLLIGGKVECGSCHDVHKQVGSSPTSGVDLRISGTDSSGRGSLLCRSCHNK